jgi:alkylhydroperoxidase family enzyme
VSREFGITGEKLQELNNYENSNLFSSDEQAVLQYAEAMTSNPAEVPNNVHEKIWSIFNESQIIELTSAIAWKNYRARFDYALKIESQGY